MRRGWTLCTLLLLGLGCAQDRPAVKEDSKPESAAAASAPKGQTGGDLRSRLESAMDEPDPAVRAAALEAVLKELPPESPPYEFLSAMIVQAWAAAGNLEKMEAASKAITIRDTPMHADVLNAMAYAYAEAGTRLTEAEFRAQQALDIIDRLARQSGGGEAAEALKTRRGAYLDTLGWIHFKNGKLEEAERLIRQSLEYVEDPEVLYHLAVVLEKKGDIEGARNAYTAVAAFEGSYAEKAKEALERLQ